MEFDPHFLVDKVFLLADFSFSWLLFFVVVVNSHPRVFFPLQFFLEESGKEGRMGGEREKNKQTHTLM